MYAMGPQLKWLRLFQVRREEHDDLNKKATSEESLSPKEEKVCIQFLKKYKKQLKGLALYMMTSAILPGTARILIMVI